MCRRALLYPSRRIPFPPGGARGRGDGAKNDGRGCHDQVLIVCRKGCIKVTAIDAITLSIQAFESLL